MAEDCNCHHEQTLPLLYCVSGSPSSEEKHLCLLGIVLNPFALEKEVSPGCFGVVKERRNERWSFLLLTNTTHVSA